MFKKGKHIKKSTNKKRINILLSVLLVICLVFVGTVLGKYIVDKTLGEKINLNIAGTPQGNVLIGDAYFEERDENDNPIPMEGFAYQLKTLTEANSKTLGDVTKIVFDIEVPSGIDKANTATKIDVSHGGREKIFAYYDSTVDASTVYVVPEELPTDGISYPMMAHEDAAAMFAGLYNLKTIEGLENVFLDSITTASEMFTGCRALTAVDLSHWTAEKLTDMQSMFEDCTSLKSLDLTSFNTANVLTMRSTFSDCSALETVELDKEKFVTDNVTDMCDMFGNCNSLKAIDVSGFNTANVIDMSFMFSGCQSLETLDVSGFDTSSLEYMSAMFCNCALLENIDVSGFKTNNVTDMSDVFLGCTALKSLDLSSWDTSNVTTMWRMFQHCSSLKKLDLSTFNTVSVTDMSEMFSNCTSLNKLYLTGWNTEKVTNMYGMFHNCYSLEKLDLSSFNTSEVTTMHNMFAECGALQTIYVSNDWSTEKVVNTEDDGDDYIDEFEAGANDLFTNCWALTGGQGTAYSDIADDYSENYDADNYDDKKYAVIDKAEELQEDGVTYGEKGYLTLYEAYTLTTGESFNTEFMLSDATTVTFGSYNMLKSEIGDIWNDETVSYVAVDDKGQGTIRAYTITNDYGTGIYVVSKDSSVIFANKDCSTMFWGMFQLTNIYGLDQVDTRNTTDMNFMFADCWMTDLDVSSFDTSNVTNMTGMFSACMQLSWLNVSGFDTSSVTDMNGMFARCESLYSLDISGFDTSNVEDMKAMFSGCTDLYELDLSKWDTGNVTDMASMFDECTSLETIYAGAGWNTDKVTSHSLMFDNCTVLVGGQGTAFDSNYIDKTYALIDAAREPNGAKGYLTDADYGTKSKILLPGGEFNAELAALLAANEGVTKVQFGEVYQFSDKLDFDYWDDTAWAANADAVLDVARSGNISAFVVGDTVYVLAKEVDYDDQYNSVIYANADCAEMFRHNVGDETGYIPSGRLTAIDGLSFVDTGNTTDMSYMFAGSSNLATVDLRSFNTAGVTNMSYMFYGCNSIGGLSLSGFDTGKVTDMSYMFYDCDSITALKLTDWDVRNVTNMNSMFYGCDKLNTLNLTGWNTSFVTDMTAMFYGDSALKTIYVDESWKTGRVDESTDMFTGCTAIVGGQGTTFDEDYTDKEYAVIDRLVLDGAKGYLTYEEAYTLISGPDFNWMLWDGDGKDEYYGLSEDTIEWEGFDGGDVRITKIVFGSYDEYKDTLGLTSWDDLAPGIALDAEQEGNIRLYIPGFDWSDPQDSSNYDQTYYILSKGSSKIIANEDCYGMLRSGPGWEEAYGLPWPIHDYHLKAIEGLDKLDTRYVTDMSMMFEYFAGESLDISNFVTSNVADMSYMFNNCGTLTSLDVTGFDTSNVTNMSGMFHYCSELETIDVSKFDTGKVTDMSNMFSSMSSLTALDLSSFDTSKVTDMSDMFAYIYADKLDISSFSTAGYPYIDGMFYSCMNADIGKYMTTIYASELWDPDKVRVDEYGYSVFGDSEMLVGGEGSTYAETAGADSDNDYKFARIDTKVSAGVPGLFTDKNAPPAGDFTLKAGSEFNSVVADLISDSSATKLQFGSWAEYGKTNGFKWQDGTDVGETANTIKAFVNESDNTVYILSAGNMYANADSSYMFKHSYGSDTGYIPQGALTAINGLDKVNTSNVTNMSHMFEYCTSLAALDVTGFNTEKVTDMSWMFRDCAALTELNLSSFDTSNVENMQEMFRYINGVTTLDVSGFNTAKVTNMQGMFQDSGNLTTITGLNSTGFNTSIVTNMSWMFKGCSALTSLDLSGFNTSSVTTMERMFGSYKGSTLDVSNFDTSSVTTMHYMFDSCSNITKLDLSNWDTSAVEGNGMQGLFNLCENLAQIDGLTGFDTSKATTMREMFAHCAATSLDLSSFDTSNVTDMVSVFYNCEELTTIYVDELWNTDNVTISDYMFYRCYDLVGGAGTEWSSSYITATRAHIDGGTANPGYLTGPSATLTTGSAFNTAINGLFSDTVTKLQFGTYNAFADTVGEWNSSTTYVDVDNDGDGSPDGLIRVFTPTGSDTVYVLSKGISQIYANADSARMFSGLVNSTNNSIQTYLKEINGLETVNTSKVTDMVLMFNYCQSLTSLDLSSFDTSSVEDMRGMFQHCDNLNSLNVSSFNTSKVTDMSYMFNYCGSLTSLDLSSFDTSSVETMRYMFQYCDSLTSLNLSSFDTSKVTTMENMFSYCQSLTSLDLSSFNTSSVENMAGMFQRCDSLTTLNVSSFNTSKVKNIRYMFNHCESLTSLDISSFNTSSVEDMEGMFQYCNSLTSLDVSSFDTSKVTDMSYMFESCRSLTSLDVSNFNTSNVETMRNMFWYCEKLTSLNVSSFDTSSVTNMEAMFRGCSGLTTLDVTNFDTSSVTNMVHMFRELTVTSLDLSNFDTSSVTNTSNMFNGCSKLVTIYVSDLWNMDTVTTSPTMFYACNALVGGAGTVFNSSYTNADRAIIDGGTANPGYLTTAPVTLTTGSDFNSKINSLFSESVTKLQFGKYSVVTASDSTLATAWKESTNFVDVDGEGTIRVFTSGDTVYVLSGGNSEIYANADSAEMFAGYKITTGTYNTLYNYLKEINGLEAVNTSKVTTMREMFYHLDNLTYVDVSGFDTSKVTTMSRLFTYCKVLTTLDVSNWDTGSVKNMEFTFCDCNALTTLDVSNWNTGSVTSMYRMFINCSGLTTLDVSNWNTDSVKSMYGMFDGCSGLTTLNISTWNTGNVTSMTEMFSGCTGLTTLDVSSWDTSNVTSMYAMFENCQKLTTLDVSNWNTSNVTSMAYMFFNCQKLTTLDVSSWNTSKVTSMSYMFFNNYVVQALDVSGFDTGNVTSMASMFTGCQKLTELDVSGFNTEKVTSMAGMFNTCTNLTDLDLTGFNTSIVTDMSLMFNYCRSLTSLDLSSFNTSSVKDMNNMFNNCSSLTSLDLSNFVTSSVTKMNSMFSTCSKLSSVDVSGFDTSIVTDMKYMFNNCQKLTTLNLSSFDTNAVTNMTAMFYNCNALTTIYASDLWSVTNVSTSTNMFSSCTALVGGEGTKYSSSYIDKTYARIDGGTADPGYLTDRWPSGVDTLKYGNEFNSAIRGLMSSSTTKLQFGLWANYGSTNGFTWANGTDVGEETGTIRAFASGDTVYILSINGDIFANVDSSNMFDSMETLTAINGLDMLDTSQVTNMDRMFGFCYALQELDLSFFKTSNVTNMFGMFEECKALTKLNISSFDTANVTDMTQMFADCHALPELDVSNFNTSKVTNMSFMFGRCYKLTSLDVSNFNTSSVENMYYMFGGLNLTSLDISNFDTRNVTDMESMFREAYNLQKIYVGDLWSIDAVTVSTDMFYDCYALTGGAGTTYNSSYVDATYAHIDGGTSNPGYFTDIAQKASASALSLDDVSATEAEESDTAADSTVEAILPVAQTKEEIESEQDADTPETEE